MNETWVRIGFFAFVLAPVWSIVLWAISDMALDKNSNWKSVLASLFFFICLLTSSCDMIFLLAGAVSVDKNGTLFVEVWNWLFYGGGALLWYFAISGYILATLKAIFSSELNDTYVANCIISTIISGGVYLFIMWLVSVSNSLITPL